MINTRATAIWTGCVAAALVGATACSADPPPPQISTWKEIATSDGYMLGLSDPHETNQDRVIKMTSDGGCVVLLARRPIINPTDVTQVTIVSPRGEIPFDEPLDRKEFEKTLHENGC